MARPKVDRQTTIYLTNEQYEALDKESIKTGVPVSMRIRMLIDEHTEQMKMKKGKK